MRCRAWPVRRVPAQSVFCSVDSQVRLIQRLLACQGASGGCARVLGMLIFKNVYKNDRGYLMESSKSGHVPVSFMQQMLHNKFLLLTVMLAVGAALYFFIGLFVLLGR